MTCIINTIRKQLTAQLCSKVRHSSWFFIGKHFTCTRGIWFGCLWSCSNAKSLWSESSHKTSKKFHNDSNLPSVPFFNLNFVQWVNQFVCWCFVHRVQINWEMNCISFIFLIADLKLCRTCWNKIFKCRLNFLGLQKQARGRRGWGWWVMYPFRLEVRDFCSWGVKWEGNVTFRHLKGPLIKIFRTPTIYGFVMLSCKIIYKLQSK